MTHIPTDEELRAQLERLSHGDDAGNIILKSDEAKVLRQIINAWIITNAVISFGGMIKTIALWILAIGAAIAATKAGMVEWLFGAQKP